MTLENEFVFKELPNGELQFVGDFDGLYTTQPDPWGQTGDIYSKSVTPTTAYYHNSRNRLYRVLRSLVGAGNGGFRGLEIGCGHGHVTSLLNTLLPVWEGMDISPKAVEQARLFHPGGIFHVGDVRNPRHMRAPVAFDVVLLCQVWWYVLQNYDTLRTTLRNCLDLLNPEGDKLLVISQAFLDDQRYGREIAVGFQGALRELTNKDYDPVFQVIHADYDDTNRYKFHDGIIVLRKV